MNSKQSSNPILDNNIDITARYAHYDLVNQCIALKAQNELLLKELELIKDADINTKLNDQINILEQNSKNITKVIEQLNYDDNDESYCILM